MLRRWGTLVAVAVVVSVAIALVLGHFVQRGNEGIDPAIAETAARASPDVGRLILDASTAVQQLQEQFPGHPEVLNVAARLHLRFGRAERALEQWNEALKLDPRCAAACNGIATTALERGDLITAETFFRKALALDLDSATIPAQLGETLLNRGQVPKAIEVLEANRRRYPKTIATLALLGQAYVQARQYAKARECLEVAVEVEPGLTNNYFSLGTACSRLGDKAKADEYFAKFRELKKRDEQSHRQALKTGDGAAGTKLAVAEIYTGVGQVRIWLGDVATGEQLLLRAAALLPDDTESRLMLAWLYGRQGRVQEAVQTLQQLTRIAGDQATVLLRVGATYQELQRLDEAEAAWRKAMELAPNQARPVTALVTLWLGGNRRLDEARALAQKAVELEPVAENYALLSVICRRTGDRAGAAAAAEQASKLEPGNESYRRLAAQARKAGN